MMPTQQITFIKGDKVGAETDYRDALPVNMTAVARPVLAAKGYMLQLPGLTLHATGEGVDRGGIWDSRRNSHYRVSGESLIRVNSNGTTTNLGSIPGNDTVEFAYSFNNLAIIASGRMFVYNTGAGLREITDSDLGNPIDICWIDQYFFMTDGESLFHTTIADETQIDPIDFATSEFSPDPTYGVEKTKDNRVMVFNRYSTEIFVNDATENFAFSRITGLSMEFGIVGTHAKAKFNDGFICVGNRKEEAVSVHVAFPGQTQKVATREIEKIIGEYRETELRSVVVETREEDGYQHVLIHLPNQTLLFNQTIATLVGLESAWSIIKSDVLGDREYRGIHGVFDSNLGKWVYGDKQNANIGIYDEDTALQYGEVVEWLLFTPYYPLETTSIDEIDIQTIPGFAMTNDSTLAVSLTFDGFRYSAEKFLNYGRRGQYGNRLITRRLGYVSEYVSFRFRGASRTRMAIGSGVFYYG